MFVLNALAALSLGELIVWALALLILPLTILARFLRWRATRRLLRDPPKERPEPRTGVAPRPPLGSRCRTCRMQIVVVHRGAPRPSRYDDAWTHVSEIFATRHPTKPA